MCKTDATNIVHYNDNTIEEWAKIFEELATIENAAWVSETGEPRFSGTQNNLFWSHLTKDRWMRKAIHTWIIYHGGSPVSFCLAIDSADTRNIIANSYDSRVAEFSTG